MSPKNLLNGRKTCDTRDFLIFLKICRYRFLKICLAKPISMQFVQTFEKMRSIAFNWEKLGKSQNQLFSLVFLFPLGYFSLFWYFFSVEYGLKIQIFWCPYRHILRRIKHTFTRVFITKGHLRWSVLIFSEECLLLMFLRIKKCISIYNLKLIPLKGFEFLSQIPIL